ncbi:DUF4181 domain-containing protein [Saccharibacillus sacchari]|uniref:DUF4181 domain-containing protein n=1 Tax=Saccharibacillus sacchari TaxID=456493 RepID=A0ACC6PCT0_9BACL
MLHLAYLYGFAAVGLYLMQALVEKIVLSEAELRTFKTEHLSQTDGYRVYSWGLGIGVFVLIVLWWTVDFMSTNPLVFLTLSLVMAFRGYMERKYIPHTRKHVVSWIVGGLSAAIALLFFLLWLIYFQ